MKASVVAGRRAGQEFNLLWETFSVHFCNSQVIYLGVCIRKHALQLSTRREVLLTDLLLVLTEVKVSAMEIVMQYKTADY